MLNYKGFVAGTMLFLTHASLAFANALLSEVYYDAPAQTMGLNGLSYTTPPEA